MRVKLNPTSHASATRSRGNFIIKQGKSGPYASAWPKKRKKATQGYDFYRQQEFGLAAQYASSVNGMEWETAFEMTKGTLMVPRDFLMRCIMGVQYHIYLEDGTYLEPGRMSNNPQYFLDLLTTVPGSMIYRSDIGWVAVPPGLPGEQLRLTDAGPIWLNPAPVAGPAPWQTLVNKAMAAGTTQETINVSGVDDALLMVSAQINTASQNNRLLVSTDGGSTYYATAGDYAAIDSNGLPTAASRFGGTDSAISTASHSYSTLLQGLRTNGLKASMSQGGNTRLFLASASPITHIRWAVTSGTITSGRLVVLGR